jgi:hypothetical protein
LQIGSQETKFDVYDHWVMNEQIPHFFEDGLDVRSKKVGACWIKDCEYCLINQSKGGDDFLGNMNDCDSAVVKGVSKVPAYPPHLCPIFVENPLFGCRECREISRFMAEEITEQDCPHPPLLAEEKHHNRIILRKLTFALSPLAVDDLPPEKKLNVVTMGTKNRVRPAKLPASW